MLLCFLMIVPFLLYSKKKLYIYKLCKNISMNNISENIQVIILKKTVTEYKSYFANIT